MKIGMRKPSIKKSISARTTGRLKREIKKTVNPMYGKKGMGMVNDFQKSVYNKVYNKTTLSVSDVVASSNGKNGNNKEVLDEFDYYKRLSEMSVEDFTEEELDSMSIEELSALYNGNQRRKEYKFGSVAFKVLAVVIAILFGLPGLFAGMIPLLIIAIIFVVLFWKLGNACK